jgi:hypothetical protein
MSAPTAPTAPAAQLPGGEPDSIPMLGSDVVEPALGDTNNANANKLASHDTSAGVAKQTNINPNKRKRSAPDDALECLAQAVQTKQCRAASHVVDISALAGITETMPRVQAFELMLTLAENAVRQSTPSTDPAAPNTIAAATILDAQTAVLDLIEFLSLSSAALCTHDRSALAQYRQLVSRAQACLKSVVPREITQGEKQGTLRIDPRIVLPFLDNRFSSTTSLSGAETANRMTGDGASAAERSGASNSGARVGRRDSLGRRETVMQSPMKRLRARVFRAVDMDWDQRKALIRELLEDVDDKRRSAMETGASQVRG